MIINRHNYEACFLLYIDNELNANDKTAVETFINQNADLAGELEMLQQATLADDSIHFAAKELLYKKETGISLANYEAYFLLAADNELNEQQISEVESFVLKHPQLQGEFTLLQQAKLKPQQMTFAGKKALYRYEKKERRLVPLFWMRMSAAAAIIGLVITTVVIKNNESNNFSTVSQNSNKPAKTFAEKDKPLVQRPVTQKPQAPIYGTKEVKNAAVVTTKPAKANRVKNKKIKIAEASIAAGKPKTDIKPETIIKAADIPVAQTAIDEPENAAPQKTKLAGSKRKHDIINKDAGSEMKNSLVKQSIVDKQPVLASHTVYIETDDEEDKTLYVGSAEINKNKLKGLFKKATVFFDKKIRRNDN